MAESDDNKVPIVYSNVYNIKFGGLEKTHPFDSCKWSRVVNFLIEKSSSKFNIKCIHTPIEATEDELLLGHTQEYLKSLKWSANVAKILELFFIALIPNRVVDKNLLRRFRFQVKGTMMAAKLALDSGWAINIGGGFHHASSNKGGGFCVYADISIAIKALMKENPEFKFLIIDLDAHQGNGHERDFPPNGDVVIMDVYNRGIYPNDEEAKRNITVNVPLISWTDDTAYMTKLNENLDKCFENNFKPNLIVYNAGTDCLSDDPLGRLLISPEGVIQRDEIVFQMAKDKLIPIVMVTSGGYQMSNANIIADSIMNLHNKKIIKLYDD